MHKKYSHRHPKNIRDLFKQKIALYKKSKHDDSQKPKYRKICKQYDEAVKKWNNSIENDICKFPSTKKFYGYVNKRLNIRQSIPPLVDETGAIKVSDAEKADILNKHVQSVFVDDDNIPVSLTVECSTHIDAFQMTKTDL